MVFFFFEKKNDNTELNTSDTDRDTDRYPPTHQHHRKNCHKKARVRSVLLAQPNRGGQPRVPGKCLFSPCLFPEIMCGADFSHLILQGCGDSQKREKKKTKNVHLELNSFEQYEKQFFEILHGTQNLELGT